MATARLRPPDSSGQSRLSADAEFRGPRQGLSPAGYGVFSFLAPARHVAPRIARDFLAARVKPGSMLARLPGLLPEAIAGYESARRVLPDPWLRQIVDQWRAARQQATPAH